MMSITILDPLLESTIRAAIETGVYLNIDQLLSDSLYALIDTQKELAIEIIARMYQAGDVSLGRACELAGLDMETMKLELQRRQISRVSDLSPMECTAAIQRELRQCEQQVQFPDRRDG